MKIRSIIFTLVILIALISCAKKNYSHGIMSDINTVSIDSEIIEFKIIDITNKNVARIFGKISEKSINNNDTLIDNFKFTNIWVKDLKTDTLIGTSTNSKGEYQLTIPASEYDIEVQFIGYNKLKIKNVNIGAGFIMNFSAIIGEGNGITEYRLNPNGKFEKVIE